MASFSERRRRYFVDSSVQSDLLWQVARYWLWGTATVALIVVIYQIAPALLSGQRNAFERGWQHLGPLLVASAVLFPIVVFDAIRFSNRFVGPMVRFRRTLKQLAEAESPPEITLRRGDYWTDVASDINAVAARLQKSSASSVNGHDVLESEEERVVFAGSEN